MKISITSLVALVSCLFALQGQAQTIYVAPNATGSGSAWSDATGNLSNALETALPGTQIWVKEGTYYPTTCVDCNYNDRNRYFEVKTGVKLYGGFAGFETEINQRNIAAHPSILSGDINQDGELAGNSFTVVFTKNVSTSTEVDGFTITGGNADQSGAGLGTPQTSGAGWFNVGSTPGSSSHPTVRNCVFLKNYAWGYGAGMFNDGSFNGACNPALTNCRFIGNVARDGGGGMYSTGSFNGMANPVLENCQFIGNVSELSDGGGMFNMGQNGNSSPSLTNCLFEKDTAFHEGGAVVNFGKNGNSSPIFTNCVFKENVAELGGGIYNDGTFIGYSGPSFLNCVFQENHSTNDGAALYNSGYQGTCNPMLMGCLFESNHSGFAGGAIFSNGNEGVSNPVLRNCRFLNNHADTYGGAMYNFGKGNLASQVQGNCSPELTNCLFYNNMALSAGAVYNLGAELGNANAMVTNCTFYGNHANIGGALYCNAGEGGTGVASPTVRNCIFWANTAGEGRVFRIIWGTPTISNSLADVADCNGLYNGVGGTVNCNGGMVFNQDPLFVSPPSSNFHLNPGSPAIDDGDNAAIAATGVGIDLDSLPRIFNNTVDLGVYEYGSTMSNAPFITQSPTSQTACAGSDLVLSISANGQQPFDFQWFKDGEPIPGASSNILNLNDIGQMDAGSYTCSVSNAAGSTTSQAAMLAVNEPAMVTIAVTASQSAICVGEPVTLSALVENGGSTPIFQWFVNGNAFGSSVQSFTTNQVQDGDTYSCSVISSASCLINQQATSNNLSIGVESLLTAALSIAVDAEPACEGSPVTLTATPVNGGNFPSYLWTLDGAVVGGDSPTLLLSSPTDGSIVQCTMNSSKTCVVENPVMSNLLELELLDQVVASLEIVPSFDSTICLGETVHFTALPQQGGDAPNFEWLLNGQPVGNGGAVFTTNQLDDQDLVACYLTSSEVCVETNPVLSNSIVATVENCTATQEPGEEHAPWVTVSPNPSRGKIVLGFLKPTTNFVVRIMNNQAQLVLESLENHANAPFRREMDLSDFPKGIYLLQIISGTQISVQKLVLH